MARPNLLILGFQSKDGYPPHNPAQNLSYSSARSKHRSPFLIMGRLATTHGEDLSESFPRTPSDGTLLDSLLSENQTKKFFVRMDLCILKDAVIGQGPVKNVKDLWIRLATSARGTTGIACLWRTVSSSHNLLAEVNSTTLEQ